MLTPKSEQDYFVGCRTERRVVAKRKHGLQRIEDEITSIQQALVLLGVKSTLMKLTLASIDKMLQTSPSTLINLQSFWTTNFERALFAREIATFFNADTELAYTAGLVQDCLLPVLTTQLKDKYISYLEDKGGYKT